MKKYALIYRGGNVEEEMMEESMKAWNDFIQDLMTSGVQESGMPFEITGKVLRNGDITEYMDSPTSINGYTIIKAENLGDAVEIAKHAPTINHGGFVEVRPIMAMDMDKAM